MITWLTSYPRSGNTWARLLLWSLRHGREADLELLGSFGRMAIHRRLLDEVLQCDSGLLKPEEIQALRPALHQVLAQKEVVVKVHDAWRLTRDGRPVHDAGVTNAAIYLIRDPRDVAVSWSAFRGRSLDWAIDSLADENAVLGGSEDGIQPLAPQYVGSWSSNATSWIDDSGLAPLVVRYEDLLCDNETWVARIAAHIGWPATPDLIRLAAAGARFERLAQQEAETGFEERPITAKKFFRTGRSGGWRDKLSAAHATRIERDHGEVMRRFGYL